MSGVMSAILVCAISPFNRKVRVFVSLRDIDVMLLWIFQVPQCKICYESVIRFEGGEKV